MKELMMINTLQQLLALRSLLQTTVTDSNNDDNNNNNNNNNNKNFIHNSVRIFTNL